MSIYAFLFMLSIISIACKAHESNEKDYIVYLGGKRSMGPEEITSTHHDILARATGSSDAAANAMIYNYKYGFSGFSARLTKEQADILAAMSEVISIYPSRSLKLLTTHSWDFLGLPQNLDLNSDVIVGILDTGIWPESESFRDTGLGPVPARWRGSCVNGPGNASNYVNCSRKIIGAKYYKAGLSPNASVGNTARDGAGHGTATSSIAAGMPVKNASMLGYARGTARGGFPAARIAMYKVCWGFQCYDMDIVKALDDAIHDGVDILSLSLGGDPLVYSMDSIAIGAYHAIERGIVVSCACGNSAIAGSVTNAAPWILTVGASTIDRICNKTGTFPYKPAPIAADFTSRGPNSISPDIIKPDVTAPGVDILAAWSGGAPAVYPFNSTFPNLTFVYVDYAIASGTSFACPHVTGAVAYLKSTHPTWSPAALKSALMTTATATDDTNNPIREENGTPATVFSIGSGEIQPVKAADPGLVYDSIPVDYILYLCSAGYTSSQIQNITGNSASQCPEDSSLVSLNYPSIGFHNLVGSRTVQRTVTNVGGSGSVYRAKLAPPTDPRVSVTVSPEELVFTSSGQSLSFNVTLTTSTDLRSDELTWVFSSLIWEDGTHSVRSPIAISIL